MFDVQMRARLGGAAGDDPRLSVVKAVLDQIAGDLVAGAPLATGRFNACTVHLFSNPLVVNENTVVGDLTECAFPGYAASAALVFSAAGIDDAGNHVVVADVPAFHVSGDPAGEQITGVYLLGAGGGTPLLAVGNVPTPIALTIDQLVPATVVLQAGNQQ